MKKLIRLATITTISLSMGLFTGCGGSGSSKKNTVTTLSCSSNPYLNTTTNTWQYSQTDTRACTPLATTTTSCSSNQMKVRVPITNNTSNNNINCPVDIYGQRHCTTGQVGTPFNSGAVNTSWNNNYNNTVNPNYHSIAGQYREVCLNYGDTSLGYVVQGNSYYYVNHQQLQQAVWTAQYHHNLSPVETIAAVGIIALLIHSLQ